MRPLLVLLMLLIPTVVAAQPAEPEGYRQSDYRAPTPATLKGARVISTEEAEALWRNRQAIFIDVLPQPPRPENLPEDTIWRGRQRDNIPDSIWLPNTGFGELAPATEAYLKEGLQNASGGDLQKPLVIYCDRGCWMSWNAAKRALSYGYGNILWYPEGTEGWSEAGLPLESAEPE
ncbi:MAG TPA: PQQ-dependent catabolism-associated CXXCW motif protein [Kiloniellales bacterium]|jgi:PQQ-dependent catabolism-associated CXXCW motif protein|nr:PQQ-dependent catabolism-associated CXXCW motif protein [Kiloniellales bacterium]